MIRKYRDNENGQGLIEYVMILSLVAMVVIAALTVFGMKSRNIYNKIVNETAVPFDK